MKIALLFFVALIFSAFPSARSDWDAASTGGTEEQLVEEIEEVVVIERVAVEVPAGSAQQQQPPTEAHQHQARSDAAKVSSQREESGEDIQGDHKNLIQRLVENGKEQFDTAKGFVSKELQLERIRGLWERREKVWDLFATLKNQNSILWVILFSLPFVVYGVLLPDKASAGASVSSKESSNTFVEYGLPGEGTREYTQQQIREYTELQLKSLDLYCNAPDAPLKDKEIYIASIQRATERAKER